MKTYKEYIEEHTNIEIPPIESLYELAIEEGNDEQEIMEISLKMLNAYIKATSVDGRRTGDVVKRPTERQQKKTKFMRTQADLKRSANYGPAYDNYARFDGMSEKEIRAKVAKELEAIKKKHKEREKYDKSPAGRAEKKARRDAMKKFMQMQIDNQGRLKR